jgi:biotin synthase-related radical SAM superfamily protein
MQWKELKARLLEGGSARLTGEPADRFIAKSTAGPGAGGRGSIFFAMGSHRVKLALNPTSTIEIAHRGNGTAQLYFEGQLIMGRLLEPGFHCPDQAFITITGSCIFKCRYCTVPKLGGRRKSIEEIVGMVESVLDRIHAISITSGVLTSIEEEEAYVLEVVKRLISFDLPIGVSIYPTENTPDHLRELGVTEVKFNLEAATPELFMNVCPGLEYETIWKALDRSVDLFGRGRVFSNVILGLGETDEELEACIRKLVSHGIIPVLRPLNPVAEFTGRPRPSAERLKKFYGVQTEALTNAGLDAKLALTMCTNCAGCDLVPGRDE